MEGIAAGVRRGKRYREKHGNREAARRCWKNKWVMLQMGGPFVTSSSAEKQMGNVTKNEIL